MAVQAVPYVETANSHSAELFRRNLLASLPAGSAGGVVPATPTTSANLTAGVAGCSDLSVNAPGSGMSVLINAGQIYVPGSSGSGSGYGMGIGYGRPAVTLNGGSAPTVSSSAAAINVQLTTQGVYYCYNDNAGGQVSLAVAAANASNPRIDVVIAQVEDAAYSGSNNDWKLAVVTGTAAASPAVPSLPASSVVLAYVWVPAAATSIIAGDILDLRIAYNRNPFRVDMSRTASYTQAGVGFTTFPFDTLISDLTGSATLGSSASFTCPVSGVYGLSAGTSFTPVSGDRYIISARKNGSEAHRMGDVAPQNTVATGLAGSTILTAVLGDVLTIAFDSLTASSVLFAPGSAFCYASYALLSVV